MLPKRRINAKKSEKKYYVILGQVLRDTLQSITYYFAKYHRCVKKAI